MVQSPSPGVVAAPAAASPAPTSPTTTTARTGSMARPRRNAPFYHRWRPAAAAETPEGRLAAPLGKQCSVEPTTGSRADRRALGRAGGGRSGRRHGADVDGAALRR